MFNNQRCCPTCIEAEKRLSSYDKVRDEVLNQMLKGTYKFPDINIYR